MRSPGSPQSAFGLFGGLGFLVTCLLVVTIAAGIAYFALTGHRSQSGQIATVIPGADVPQSKTAAAPQAPAENGNGLQSMPAEPAAKEIALRVAIEEELSPTELMSKYPPEANAGLAPGAADLPAWQRYGRASAVSPSAPRAALIIIGLGGNKTDTVRAITGAPPEASLSFTCDATGLADWIAAARAFGHEALLDVKLESIGSADSCALARNSTSESNLRQLDQMLAKAPMIAGVTIRGGDSFLADAASLQPILDHLRQRGLAIIGLPVTAPLVVAADETIAAYAPESAIDRSIESVMTLALRRGAALGIAESTSAAFLFPAWYRALSGHDEISLVPASALAEK